MKLLRVLLLLTCLFSILLVTPALAEDVCYVRDAASTGSVTTDCSYLRVGCPLPGDVPVTYADVTALERDFGFKPSTSLREGLRRFAQWYKEFYRV